MYNFARARPLARAVRAAAETPLMRSQQRRGLAIHEYRSAALLESYGIGVPKGGVATSGAEAEKIAKDIGGEDAVIKAQVLAGGRGKGTFDNGFKGGVRVVHSPREASILADQMIGHKLITKQTGAAGRLCNSVFIVDRKFARREFYLAILMDRASQGPVIVASSQGGMDIETVAKEHPEAIITTPIDIHKGVTDDIARNIATELGFSEQCIEDAKDTIQKLYKVFMEKDATQIEINLLSETTDHQVLAMDAKLNFDDNADFRQKEVFDWRDITQEDPEEVKAAKVGLNFIKLDGDIGCLVNGAGLAMATMDIIKLNGGAPCQLPRRWRDPKVTAIFVNIFGGIVRCDAIAKGLIQVVNEMNLKTPVIARLQGTNMEAAHKLLNDSGLKIFSIDDLQAAAEKSVQFSKVVKMARDIDVGVEFTLWFNKALILRKENGSEIVAKIPFAIAGPPKYTTASEVALTAPLLIVYTHTQVPVPRVLAWDADSSNAVGAEYIIMEKAPGVQLFKVWGDMNELDQIHLAAKFTEFEGQMAEIHFPANGSLYLTKSMTGKDKHIVLDQDIGPSGEFCIGPSCERRWYTPNDPETSHYQGPWPNLSSFGTAFVERELSLVRKCSSIKTSGAPRGTLEDHLTVLNMAKEVMSRMNARTLIGKVSEPALWHTDLHMGNIYVSEKDSTEIVSLIDWQSVVVSPLFLQARFPIFLDVDENYPLDDEDKVFAEYKLRETTVAKGYELSTASEEGVIPLRACLIEYAANWEEIGFEGECPISFSEEDLKRHEQQFDEYSNYHKVHEWARGILGTDAEGWLMPMVDIEEARKKSDELLEEFVRRCDQYNMTPERMREIWLYLERP
ncbi:unnamed protein product [Alternaria alternata]